MRTRIIRVGNSRGIRIPKPMLEQTGLSGEVELEVEGDHLILRPAARVRSGWASAFEEMARAGDDSPLDPLTPASSWEDESWEW